MSDAVETLITLQAELQQRILQVLIDKRPELLAVGAALLETSVDDVNTKAFLMRAWANVSVGSFWDLAEGYTRPGTSYEDLRRTVLTLFTEAMTDATLHRDKLAGMAQKPVERRMAH